MTTTSTNLRIDIVSDVMCPWCVIGYRQLASALASKNLSPEIHWHPFELNPNMPAEGQNLREHVAEKYGSTAEESAASRGRLIELGKELGFQFNFTDDFRMQNTFSAHQLLHWANEQGCKHALKQALFEAHFTHGLDISDIDVLADIAAELGLDRAAAHTILTKQKYAETVRAEQQFWIQQGIQGVPAVVFNGRHLVTGAQGVENYTNILKHLETVEA